MRARLPGLLLSTILGLAAFLVSRATPTFSPLLWAILIGAVLGNVRPDALPWERLQPGIAFSGKPLLRLAVGLLGIRLGLGQIVAVGAAGAGIVALAVVGSFAITVWAAARIGLSRTLACTLGAGTSICGAAACVAAGGVVEASEEETAVALATVTLLGTIAIFVYPAVGRSLALDPRAFGLWAGASIHEVAQVVAAASAYAAATGTEVVETATVVKLGRVLLLAPVTVLLAFTFRRERGGLRAPVVPWFVVLFVAMIAVKSTGTLPESVSRSLVTLDALLLSIAMAALGLDLRLSRLRAAGLRPVYAGAAGWLATSVAVLAAAAGLYG